MTTHLRDPPASPSRKPPILTPKPVLATPGEGQPVENGDFHRKLERFKNLSEVTDSPGQEPREAFQTQTIRRRTKSRNKEQKNYERLNVSPVRRRPSQPSPQRGDQRRPAPAKKRSESDGDYRGVPQSTGNRRQEIERAIDSLTQELGMQNKRNTLRKKPVPLPKKPVPGDTIAGESSRTVLSAKGLDPGIENNNVQSTTGHSGKVPAGRTAGKPRTGEKPVDKSDIGRTLDAHSPHVEKRFANQKKALKPTHPKPVQRKTARTVILRKGSPLIQNGGRNNVKSEFVVPPSECLGQNGNIRNRKGENMKVDKAKVVPKPKPKPQIAQENNSSIGRALSPPHPQLDKIVEKEGREVPNLGANQRLSDPTGVKPVNGRVEQSAEHDQNGPEVPGISKQSLFAERQTSSQSSTHQESFGSAYNHDVAETRPEPDEDVTKLKRKSVLDIVGNFESKQNTKTLGRITRKKKPAGLGPRNVSDASREKTRPGLSRRLSRSLGNINEISHSDEWGQRLNARFKKFDPKAKKKVAKTASEFEPTNKTESDQSKFEPRIAKPDPVNEQNEEQILSIVTGMNDVISEERSLPEPSVDIPKDMPVNPSRTFVQEMYDTPNPSVNSTSVNIGAPRRKALRPPATAFQNSTSQPPSDVSQAHEALQHPANVSQPDQTSSQPIPEPPSQSLQASQLPSQPPYQPSLQPPFQPPLKPPSQQTCQQPPTELSQLSYPPPPPPATQTPLQPPVQPHPQPITQHQYQEPQLEPQSGQFQPQSSQPPPPPPVSDSPKVILREKGRRTLPRSHRINRKASVDRPGYAPPRPPVQEETNKYNIPLNNTIPRNRNSVIEISSTRPVRKHSRPKSESSFVSGTIYATPGISVDDLAKHNYHVLENQDSLPMDAIFGQRIPSKTLEDEGGYTIPGSHMWGVLNAPGLPDSSIPPAGVERPRAASHSSDGRPRSNNNAVPPGIHGYTEPTQPEGPVNGKEGHFKPLSKMRRKIHEAFKSKARTEEDTASVTSEDSDLVDDAITEKRLTAVRKIKARTSHYCSLEQTRKNGQFAKLYEYVVVVSLTYDKIQRRYEPCEIRRFPEEVSDSQNDKLRAIPHFCFPDSFKWAPVESYNSETFSFVLTSFDGSRFYGYNRRLLPPGDGARLPEVFCVMSPVACYPVYFQLLDEIERRRKHSMEEVEVLLKVAYDKSLPRPGGNVRISAHLTSQVSVKDTLFLQRPQDSRLEQIDFDYLFKCISIPHVLQIFGSLLLERRIVMFSSYLSKLSKCSQAIASLLYPFAWQHVYVPVLPMKLLDMCCSPTPYIMGMLSLSIPELEDMPLDEVLIVNLDAGEFDVHVGDESTILPRRLYHGLEKALKTCLKENDAIDSRQGDSELSEDCETRNKSISEAFILYFVELMGHYLNHFHTSIDGSPIFDRDGFVKGTNSKSIRRFLEVFTETQMFSLFIQEKETESDEGILQSLFDQRIQGYESERRNSKLLGVVNVKKIGQNIARTAKGVKGKVKSFDDKI